jgi:hypothetical protein
MVQANSWKQSGSVSLWRYTENLRNFPGWHLTADAAGCASLLALLDALAFDGVAASRTLGITAPTASVLAVPNNRSSGWVAPSKFRLAFSPRSNQWGFPDALEPASLSIGADWLPTLRQAIAGIPQGQGDYSIGQPGNGSLPLWIWWQPAAA